MRGVANILETALGLLFPTEPEVEPDLLRPPFCARCARPVGGRADGDFRCANCSGTVLFYGQARAWCRNRGAVRESIHRFKYGKEYWLRRRLGGWLVDGWQEYFAEEEHDFLVPVPLHAGRRRWREFNQARELALMLSRASGIPVREPLRRAAATTVQAKLHRAERAKNVRGAFVLAKGADVGESRVLVIDDVMTTGSTVNECARVLKKAGARSVDVLCVARA